MSYDGVSRRHFFFGTLLAGAVPVGGYGSVPSLRALGYKPFYDKLNVAAIGCGGQGGVDLNDAAKTENIVAVCDVDENYVPYNWRGFYDFGTGQIGNWATHAAGPVQAALQLGAPTSVERTAVVGESRITFPDRAVIRLDFPARGGMPPVKVYYHDSSRTGTPEAYRVPGMENETILPPANNLADKGRPTGERSTGGRPAGPPAAAPRPDRARQGAGGPGVRVFGERSAGPEPGVLTGNGAVFVGTKGIMATRERGEGVWLLPASRWKEYVLPPQLLTRSPGHMLDFVRACKGGEASCSDFSITAPFAEWLALAAIAFRVPGKLDWDSKNLRFTNSAEANKYVKPVFRKGWELTL